MTAITSNDIAQLTTSGAELRALLHPITPESFVHEYWGKQPLVVKGTPEKYAGLFDAEAFSRAITPPGPFPENFLRASFDRKTATGTSAESKMADELRSTAFGASVDQAIPLFDAGATLCVSQIETRVPRLATFSAAVKRQLGYTGKVSFNAYLSPAGGGYNWHFDSRIASTLQIEGSKRWRYSLQPAIAWPRGNGSLRGDGTPQYADPGVNAQQWERLAPLDESAIAEVLLEPGDLLVLPAGVWHEACGGGGGSLALNLTFTPISYTLLVRNLLDGILTSEAAWRGPAPVLPGATPGEVDAAGIEAITEQLARAGALLQSLSGDSAAVVRLWESYVQNANPAAPVAFTPLIDTAPVTPEQRLRVRDDGNFFAMLADGGSRLCLLVGTSREADVTGVAIAFVQRMLAERSFIAGDCMAWSESGTPFEWSDVQVMLTSLKRQGLIDDATA
jgi:hypothetical protein